MRTARRYAVWARSQWPLLRLRRIRHRLNRPFSGEIMDLTRQGLEAAKRKDSTFKQRTLADDALDVGEFGIWGKERSAASLASLEKHPNVELKDFSLSDYRFRKACDDVVVVAYRADLTSVSVSNGQQTSVVQYISAVWVRRGKTWRRLLSQHTTAPPQS